MLTDLGRIRSVLVWAVIAALGMGCSGGSQRCMGKEQCACYPNSTCNAGLSCLSNLCVNAGGLGGAGNGSGGVTGGDSGGANADAGGTAGEPGTGSGGTQGGGGNTGSGGRTTGSGGAGTGTGGSNADGGG